MTMMFTSLTAKKCTGELAELRIFAGCTKHEVRRIERLVLRAHVAAGRVLCRQGEFGRECFVVVSGRAITTIDGRRVGSVEPGEVIGEVALLSYRGRRIATVTAETPMTLLVLTKQEFALLLSIAPSVDALHPPGDDRPPRRGVDPVLRRRGSRSRPTSCAPC